MKRSICLYILCFAVVAGAGYLFTGCGAAANPADELDAKTMPTENANDAAVDNGIPDDIALRLKNAVPEDAGKVRQEIQKERLDAAQVELGKTMDKLFVESGMKAIKDRVDSQAKNGHLEDDAFGTKTIPTTRLHQGTYTPPSVSTYWTYSSIPWLNTCPADKDFETIVIPSGYTLFINGCEINISTALNIAGTLDARSSSSSRRTVLNLSGAMTLLGNSSTLAVLKTANTDINIDSAIWLWARAKWDAARDSGNTGTTIVKPRAATYWPGVAIWGNYSGSPALYGASVWLKNTSLQKAIYAINPSIYDTGTQTWLNTYADISLDTVYIENAIAGVTYHQVNDASIESTTVHTYNNVSFVNTDSNWFYNVYTDPAFGWQSPYRPWWAFGMEDTQSSVTEVDISNNSDMYSSIDWAQPPIFARRYNAITHVSSCSFYHRPTDVANHVLFEDAKAQTWVSSNTFYDYLPSSGYDSRSYNIYVTINTNTSFYGAVSDAVNINDNYLGRNSSGSIRYTGLAGLNVDLYDQSTPITNFTANIYNNYIADGATGGMLYTLRAMGAYNDGSQWANVNIYSNVINIRRTSTSGIVVGLFNVAHIYGNTLSTPENPDQNNPIYLFAYGIDASINNELEINDNSFYGPIRGKWITFSYDCGSTSTNAWIYNNNDTYSTYLDTAKAVDFQQRGACSYCPNGQVVIGYNRSNICVGSGMQHLFSCNCPPTAGLTDCN